MAKSQISLGVSVPYLADSNVILDASTPVGTSTSILLFVWVTCLTIVGS